MTDAASHPLLRVTQFIHALQKMAPLLASSLKQYFIKTGLITLKRGPNQSYTFLLYVCVYMEQYI